MAYVLVLVRHGDQYVFKHAHLGQQSDDLECSPNPSLSNLIRFKVCHIASIKKDAATVGFDEAANQVKHGRFSGSVRSNQCSYLASFNMKVTAFDSVDASELFVKTVYA